MSRFKRFAHSLASGYVLLGANVVYALASVPLALSYLSRAEFGLWATTTSIAQYIGLIDMGMTSTSRILIDYKDRKNEGAYGSVIQTFVLVSVVQAGLMVLLSVGVASIIGPMLKIDLSQRREFFFLIVGQCLILAAGFVTRIWTLLLAAHQRYDLTNYSQVGVFALMYAAMWLAFAKGAGVYSTLWAQATAWAAGALVACVFSFKLRLFPNRGCWGRASWSRFRELFSLGSDLFLYALGFQLLNASQTLVLTRGVGLEAAAVWSVCTRTYSVVTQLIYRIFDYSITPLSEMIVREEKELLYRRIRQLAVVTGSLSVLCAAIFAACNQPFVRVWLGGKFAWSPWNDALLGAWLVFEAVARCHLGLVGGTKDIRSMRYVYLVEGTFFVTASLLTLRWGGITGMLVCAVIGALLFSSPYGYWRTSRYFGVPFKVPAWEWWGPSLRLAAGLVPVTVAVWWLTQGLPAQAQLVIRGAVTGSIGAVLLLRFGLDQQLKQEPGVRVPERLRPGLIVLGGRAWG